MLSVTTYPVMAVTRSLGPCEMTITAGPSHGGRGMVRNKGARIASLVAVAVLAVGGLAACGSSDRGGGSSSDGSSSSADATGKVGVILPDTTTSPRWEANDRPSLQAAFDEAGIDSDIQNA